MKKNYGRKVFVYRNLHKRCFSVKDVKTGLVIAHVDSIVLTNCQFKVSQAGRTRVLKEKRKNVHAGVVGIWTEQTPRKMKTSVKYNPYKYSSFVRAEDETPILVSRKCLISQKGVSASE